ncbi:MAG TPA: DUF4235 domain-containing protein [Solirubrobacterales bacterium]
MRFIFAPIGILAGLVAGFAAQKGFERLWAVIDEEDPPEIEDREVSYPKLVAALLLEGAVFRLVKGMVDRGARLGFASMTGVWPGEEDRASGDRVE